MKNKKTMMSKETTHSNGKLRSLIWAIKMSLKAPARTDSMRDNELNTTEKTIDTIESRSFPGASSESLTRKTIIIGERGKEVVKTYGAPPDERSRISSEAEKTKERLVHNQKATHEGEKRVTISIAIYTERDRRKYFNLAKLIKNFIRKIPDGHNKTLCETVAEFAKEKKENENPTMH